MFWPFSTIYNAIAEATRILQSLTATINAFRAEAKGQHEALKNEVIKMGLDLTRLSEAVSKLQTEVVETAETIRDLRDRLGDSPDIPAIQIELDGIAAQLETAAGNLDSLQDKPEPDPEPDPQPEG